MADDADRIDKNPTVWAFKVGAQTVRFDDLTPDAWERIDNEHGEWYAVYTLPLRHVASLRSVLVECVRKAEPDCDPVARANELTPSMRSLSDLLVEVESDLPTVVTDGVPPVGADG
jgi:hypothetical protein